MQSEDGTSCREFCSQTCFAWEKPSCCICFANVLVIYVKGSALQFLWAKSYMVIDVSLDKMCESLNELKPAFVELLTR